jgi:hypothetical protein
MTIAKSYAVEIPPAMVFIGKCPSRTTAAAAAVFVTSAAVGHGL